MNCFDHFRGSFFSLPLLGDWLKDNVSCGSSSTGITHERAGHVEPQAPPQMLGVRSYFLTNPQVIHILIKSLRSSILENKTPQNYF